MAKTTKKAHKNNNTGKKVALVILSVILLALLAVVVLIGVKSDGFKNWDFIPGNNTPGGSSDDSPLTLIYDERVIDEVNIDGKQVVRIYVQNGGKYSVKIQPKASVFFDFRLDGKLHAFTAESGDYNKAFNLDVHDDYFEISSEAQNITDVLNRSYFGHVVSDVDELANQYDSYFEIVVTAQNEKKKTADIIGVGNPITIKINPDKLVF